MSTRFPGRAKEANRDKVTGVRLLPNQREFLEQKAQEYNTSISMLIIEAVSQWIARNSKGSS